jgi:hypothetical protein
LLLLAMPRFGLILMLFSFTDQFARCDFKPIRPKIFVNRQENQAYRPHALEIVSLRALLYQSCE